MFNISIVEEYPTNSTIYLIVVSYLKAIVLGYFVYYHFYSTFML